MDTKHKTDKVSKGGKVSSAKKKTPIQPADSVLRSVLNATLDTLYTFDLKARKAEFIIPRDFLGYTSAELTSDGSIFSAVHEEDRANAAEFWEKLPELKKDQSAECEIRFLSKDKACEWVRCRATTFIQNEAGTPDVVLVALSVISDQKRLQETARKEAEQKLIESQRNEQFFLNTLSEGAALNEIVYDENGIMVDYRILKANPAFYDVVDFHGEDIIGKTATEIYKMPVEMITSFWKTHREKNEVQHTEMLSPINGKAFYVSTSPFIEDKFVTAFFDMIELKNAQAELAASRDMFKRLVEQITLGIQIFDLKGLCVDVNEAHCQIFGATREQLVNHYNIFEDPLADTMGTGLAMRRALKGESVHLIEQQFDFSKADLRFASGTERVLNISIIPIFDTHGKVANVVGLNEDITAKKRDEDRIRTQVQRLSALRSIDAMIKSSLDLKSIIEILLNETVIQLNVDAASLALFNKDSMMLEYAGKSGFHNPSARRAIIPINEGYAGQAILNRKLIHVQDLSSARDKHASTQALLDEKFVSYVGVPLITKGQAIGAFELFSRKELNPDSDWFDFLENLADQAAIAVENVQLFLKLQRSNFDMILAYDATIEGWSRAMDLRDRETNGHTQRITSLCVKLAHELNMREDDLAHLRHGALLHDIGNLGVPDHVLLKTEELNEEEREAVRKHPALAYDMLKNIVYLKPALDIPYCHHEKWDGSGYPRGLKGDEIPLSARIFAVVDVWDALCSRRPYREAWSWEKTLDYIRAESGKHFDPRVVEAFLPLAEEENASHLN